MIIRLLDTTDDKETLANCTLVARSWLSISRSYLFERVYIAGPGQDDDPPARFLAFLSRNPYICSRIRRIVIRGLEDQPRRTSVNDLLFRHLISILEALSNLQSLTLSRVDMDPEWDDSEWDEDDTGFPLDHAPRRDFRLKELVLRHMRSDRNWVPIDMPDLIGLFVAVDNLYVAKYAQDMEFLPPELIMDMFDSIPPPDLCVKSMKVRYMESISALFWLEYVRRSPSREFLESLDCHCNNEAEIRSCAALISDAASTLTHVAIDLCRLPVRDGARSTSY